MPFVILGILNVLGVAILGLGLYSLSLTLRVPRWPTVPGRITHLDFESSTNNDLHTTYKVTVGYRYTVAGVDHEGSRLSMTYAPSSSFHQHRQIYDKLKDGPGVLVRYRPDDPGVSCLSYGVDLGSVVVLVFAVIWLSISLSISLAFWFASRPESPLLRNLIVD